MLAPDEAHSINNSDHQNNFRDPTTRNSVEDLLKIQGVGFQGIYGITENGIAKIYNEALIDIDGNTDKEDFLNGEYTKGNNLSVFATLLSRLSEKEYIDLESSALSLNLHPLDFLHPRFQEVLNKYFTLGGDYRNIVLEILEHNVSSQQRQEILGVLVHLKEAYNFRIALDDYAGSEHNEAYSDFSELLDIVKIDRHYFNSLSNYDLHLIVASFQEDNKKVVIEGIDTQSKLQKAVESGAELYQGYFLDSIKKR